LKAMAPYIARELKKTFGTNWWQQGVYKKLEQNRGLPESGDDQYLINLSLTSPKK